MLFRVLFTYCLVWNITLGQQVIITTVPDTPVSLIFNEGTLNVSLYCEVIQNNEQIQTRWLVQRTTDSMPLNTDYNAAGELISPADLVGKITAIGDVIPNLASNLTFETNFTILNFTSEFHRVLIKCGPQGTLREFNLGFPSRYNTDITINLSICLFSCSISINSC